MQYNLPKNITNENDLVYYEKYLLNDSTLKTLDKDFTYNDLLRSIIGNFVIIELSNCRKMGVITETGKDYLILGRSNNNTLIPFINIKSVILPQGNQKLRRQ